MLILAIVLSVLMGVTLGLLGGGGSILTVPLLVYIVKVDPKEAIATSLLVVGITSIAGMIQHARAGQVKWKVGLIFGAFAMAGAYLGGMVAQYIDGNVLLGLFAILSAVTGIAMLRGKKEEAAASPSKGLVIWKIALEGLVVGGITGLVGAGGGFLVVPALIFFGGLSMRAAVGTSLLVIAMKSFAGLAGHLQHVTLDYEMAGMVAGAAVVGSVFGALIAKRIPAARLRTGFALFVIAMASFMLYKQASPEILNLIFVERWPFWAGGIAIGGFVVTFFLATRKALGVSTGYVDCCGAVTDDEARRSWRLPFLGGIVLGGLVAALAGPGLALSFDMGMFDTVVSSSLPLKAGVFTLGGIMLGFGSRLAGGCTSGHGIVGVSLLAPASLITTATFMAVGFVVTNFAMMVLT